MLLLFLQRIGWLYGVIQAIRRWGYRIGIFPSFSPPCPVISVGNLTAGGTGKTPFVVWLVDYFQKRGLRVAVVSRGYRQGSKQSVTLVANAEGIQCLPPFAADEAVLVALKQPGVTVLTGSDRRKTITAAIRDQQCDLVIMDDGFQHLRVNRQLDLLLLDCMRPLGNGYLLPGGILREFPSALRYGDGLIFTRAAHPCDRRAARQIVEPWWSDESISEATHHPKGWLSLPLKMEQATRPLALSTLTGQSVMAFCGIADPSALQQTLTSLPLRVVGFQAFPDHHPFDDDAVWNLLIQQARTLQAHALVCTEKDAVKIQNKIQKKSGALPVYALVMEFRFLSPPSWLLEKLETLAPVIPSKVS